MASLIPSMPIPPPPPPSHLLTLRLVLLPTPHAIHLPAYTTLYANLHSSTTFCTMGFGPHWLARDPPWSEKECKAFIQREVTASWEKRGVGDFAVGLRKKGEEEVDLDKTEWIGYAGIRDGHLSMPADDTLPEFLDLVEVRYGISPTYWGNGFAPEAMKRVLEWGEEERGVRRYVAETERDNERSGNVLSKLGFKQCESNYWKKESQVEWECRTPLKGPLTL